MPDLITVNVTAEDLAQAKHDLQLGSGPRADLCPVARALSRTLGTPCTVGIDDWGRNQHSFESLPLPPAAVDAALRFDAGLTVEPFTFEIERPR